MTARKDHRDDLVLGARPAVMGDFAGPGHKGRGTASDGPSWPPFGSLFRRCGGRRQRLPMAPHRRPAASYPEGRKSDQTHHSFAKSGTWAPRAGVLALAMLAALAGGCGFRPLHGSQTVALPALEIAPIGDRLGQIMRNQLRDRLVPTKPSDRPPYRLAVHLDVSKEGLAIAKDESATRFTVRLAARFEIVDLAAGNTLHKGNARATAAYNVVSSDFATLSAERDAERRAAREVAAELITQVAVFFSRRAER